MMFTKNNHRRIRNHQLKGQLIDVHDQLIEWCGHLINVSDWMIYGRDQMICWCVQLTYGRDQLIQRLDQLIDCCDQMICGRDKGAFHFLCPKQCQGDNFAC